MQIYFLFRERRGSETSPAGMVYFLSESRIDADSADFADFLIVFVSGGESDGNCLDTDSWEEHRVGTRPTPTEFVIDMGLLWKTEMVTRGPVNFGISVDFVWFACYAAM